MNKKKKSKFNRMAKIVIWVMLFAMVGATLISALYSILSNI